MWVHIVQHVTGFNHQLCSFSLPMSVLMYQLDGPGGTKLICKQVCGVGVWKGVRSDSMGRGRG